MCPSIKSKVRLLRNMLIPSREIKFANVEAGFTSPCMYNNFFTALIFSHHNYPENNIDADK